MSPSSRFVTAELQWPQYDEERRVSIGENQSMSWTGVLVRGTYDMCHEISRSPEDFRRVAAHVSEGFCGLGESRLVPDGEWGRCPTCAIRWQLLQGPFGSWCGDGPREGLLLRIQPPLTHWLDGVAATREEQLAGRVGGW